jgi:hypothetical protein
MYILEDYFRCKKCGCHWSFFQDELYFCDCINEKNQQDEIKVLNLVKSRRKILVKIPYFNLVNADLAMYIAKHIEKLDINWLLCPMVLSAVKHYEMDFLIKISEKMSELQTENTKLKIQLLCEKYLIVDLKHIFLGFFLI